MVAAMLLEMPGGIVAEQRKRQAFRLQGLENFPGAVGAVVVKHKVAVHPGQGMANEGFDNIGFIFDDGYSDQTHQPSMGASGAKRSQN